MKKNRNPKNDWLLGNVKEMQHLKTYRIVFWTMFAISVTVIVVIGGLLISDPLISNKTFTFVGGLFGIILIVSIVGLIKVRKLKNKLKV